MTSTSGDAAVPPNYCPYPYKFYADGADPPVICCVSSAKSMNVTANVVFDTTGTLEENAMLNVTASETASLSEVQLVSLLVLGC